MRWEYQGVRRTFGDQLENDLNLLGDQGWELVSIAGLDRVVTLTGNKIIAVLKREVAEDVEHPRVKAIDAGGWV